MSHDKLIALQELVTMPKDYNKLVLYERKLNDACTFLLFDCRKIILQAIDSSRSNSEAKFMVPPLQSRIDRLIDQSRSWQLRLRPGTAEKVMKVIANNVILFDLIIFSRCWDLKEELRKIDSLIIFNEASQLKDLVKAVLDHIQIIDELYSSKENAKVNIQSSEEVGAMLINRFNSELVLAEQAGALKGILKLEKPKLIGKSKYYEQLGNILLKIAFSFGFEHSDEPIAIQALTNRLNDEYPRIEAELKDVLRALEMLDQNGFLRLTKDYQGFYWINLKPSESEANIILALAEKKGFLTIEEIMLETKWPIEKVTKELEKFVQAGCAVKDSSYSTGVKYYFPGLTSEE
ncbi:MAG: hypothetical protein FK734_16690 [Asgard group archaeon]|nr:hypothetical protein [Asgard group archaeon]